MSWFKLFKELVYDEDGDTVECDWCGQELIWKNGEYYCPGCEEIWSREKFFDYIGADPPGDECYDCDNLYPGCIACPHGYADDEDDT